MFILHNVHGSTLKNILCITLMIVSLCKHKNVSIRVVFIFSNMKILFLLEKNKNNTKVYYELYKIMSSLKHEYGVDGVYDFCLINIIHC